MRWTLNISTHTLQHLIMLHTPFFVWRRGLDVSLREKKKEILSNVDKWEMLEFKCHFFLNSPKRKMNK